MIEIHPKLAAAYNGRLAEKDVPKKLHPHYRKWLRHYLDFCGKYKFDKMNKKSLPAFMGKLRDKKQSEFMRRQAGHAVSLFHQMYMGEIKSTQNKKSVDIGLPQTKIGSKKKDGHLRKKREKDTAQRKEGATSAHAGPATQKIRGADWHPIRVAAHLRIGANGYE